MKLKHFLIGGAVLPLLLQCSSCDLENHPEKVTMDIVWQTPVAPQGQISMAFDGNIAFRDEYSSGGFIGINFDKGSIFKQITGLFSSGCNPVVINNSLYFYDYTNPLIWEFTKEGNFVRKIWVTSGSGKPDVPPGYIDPYMPRMASWSANGTRLYWGAFNSFKDAAYGVETIDVLIDPQPTGEPNEYWVKPTLIYADLGFNFSCEYLFDADVMYIGAWRQDWSTTSYNGYVAAINLSDYSLVWKSTTTSWKNGRGILYLNNNKLYAQKAGLNCLDAASGSAYYEKMNVLTGDAGGTFINGRIYISNESGGNPPLNGIYNIQCVDLATGNLLWYYHDPIQSLGQNPIVYQGICYVPTQIDVKLFNAETGQYLGYATNITGDSNISNSNYLWVYNGDTWMIINGSNFVAAVRLNFRLDGSGGAVQGELRGEWCKSGLGYELLSFLYLELDAFPGIYNSGHTFAILFTLTLWTTLVPCGHLALPADNPSIKTA